MTTTGDFGRLRYRARLVELDKELRSFDQNLEIHRVEEGDRLILRAQNEETDFYLAAEFIYCNDPQEEPAWAECHYVDYRCHREVHFHADYDEILDLVRQMLTGRFQLWSGTSTPLAPFFHLQG